MLPTSWKLWKAIPWLYWNSYPDKLEPEPVLALECHKVDSCCQILLDLLDTNKIIYQRGITPTDLKQCSPQVLSGNLILVVFKPIMIEKLAVNFKGIKFETLFELSMINSKNYASTIDYVTCYLNGQKRSHYTKIIDDSLVYDNDLLSPGIYTFPFQFLVDPLLPSSIISSYLNITYKVHACLSYNTGPSLSSNTLNIHSEVLLIRCLPDSVNLNHDSLIANGNWRNLLIYEFNFQNKFAYQNLPYSFFINLYSINDKFQLFEIHSISIHLIQQCQFDKIGSNHSLTSLSSSPSSSSLRQKHSEINKVLLFSKVLSLKDFNQNLSGGFSYKIEFKLPSVTNNHDSDNKKLIYPTIINDNNEGFTTTHNLKVSLEVSQLRNKKSFKPNRPNSKTIDINSKVLDGSAAPIPSYSTYHRCKNEASKYKKMELSFSSPILLLSPQSCHGAKSPPLYSHINNSIPVSSSENLNNLFTSSKFRNKNRSLIVPPSYSEVSC